MLENSWNEEISVRVIRDSLSELIQNELEGKKETMKQSAEPTPTRSAKRDLFEELIEGMNALAEARQGKQVLRTYSSNSQNKPCSHEENGN